MQSKIRLQYNIIDMLYVSKRIKKLQLLLLVCFIQLIANGQTSGDFISLNNFIPPSPEAAALGRYGQIPINQSTGIPSINVPIYDIKTRKLSLPLSLSYHASGIKVEDIATIVGLGWSLNAGGAITRNIVGIADEQPNGMRNLSVYEDRANLENVSYSSNNYTHYNYLKNLSNGTWDTQSDIYDINTPAFTGRFVYDIGNKQAQWTPVDKQLKISWNSTESYYTVTDDDGTIYIYSEKENSGSSATGGITAWYPTYIISSDLADTIYFKYKDAAPFQDVFQSQKYTINVQINAENPNVGYCQVDQVTGSFNSQPTNIFYYRKLLDSIVFANGYVKFNYANDRQDPGKERLTDIMVGSGTTLVKQITLTHSYFYSPNTTFYNIPDRSRKRLKLEMVSIKGTASSPTQQYSFDYDTTNILPFYYRDYDGSAPLLKTASFDLWGYYNGSNSVYMLPADYRNELYNFLSTQQPAVSNSILSDYDSKSYDRSANPIYAKSCILTKVRYPTGGTTSFQYEGNKIANNGNNKDYTGGLRVKKITSEDNLGHVYAKEYSYGDAGLGIPITRNIPENFFYTVNTITQRSNSGVFCHSANFYVTANTNTAINYYGGSPVIYSKVTEYESAAGKNNGKTEFYFDCEGDSVYGVPYVSKYWNFSSDKGWARGQVLDTKTYKYENGNYTLIKDVTNTYAKIGTRNVKVGYVCEQMTQTTNISLDGYLNYPYLQTSDYVLLNYFDFIDVHLPFGIKKLIKSEETDYANQSVTSKKEYFYESSYHLYPTKIKTLTSTGDYFIEVFKYPQDKAAISNLSNEASSALDGMSYKNMLSPVAETEMYKNATLLIRNRTEFQNWKNTNRYYEAFKNQQRGQNSMEQRVQYQAYDDRGNIATLSKVGDVSKSYIWGYNKRYPIAELVNAGSSEIFHSSFEEGIGWGNGPEWQYGASTLTSYDNSRSRTGRMSGKIDKPSTGERVVHADQWLAISNAQPTLYKYSGWVYSTGPSVDIYLFMKTPTETFYYTAVDYLTTTVTNQWVYVERTISVPANITKLNLRIDNNGGGTVWFDDLRLHPAVALMTTYTYDPLIGMTSQTDANNRTTFYEYDGFGRLSSVRDNEKNILKKFCYNYAGQQESCSAFSSAAINNYFYSQNCAGLSPVPYYVSLPEGQFASSLTQSDADQQAQQYAQGQANQYGTCQQPSIAIYAYNNSSTGYSVELYNPATGNSYWFDIYGNFSGTIGYVPQGTYSISISPYNTYSYHSYYVGCGYSTSGYNGASFSNIPLNSSCNSISIY